MSEIKVNSVVNSTGDNDSGLDLSTNDQVIIKTANTTALTVDSSQDTTLSGNIKKTGNLTIDVSGQLVINSDSGQVVLQDDTVNWGNLQNSSGDFVIESLGADKDMIFKGLDGSSVITALTLDMSEGGDTTFNSNVRTKFIVQSGISSGANCRQTTASGNHAYFASQFRDNSGNVIGSIQVNTTNTNFNTSSDYRLKENVTYDFDATSRLKELKPARFNWIKDSDTTVDGFLAHEVSHDADGNPLVPEAVTGSKDATQKIQNVVLNADGSFLADNISEKNWTKGKLSSTDDDGNTVDPIYASDTTWVASKTVPDYQSIDQSKLVPLLVKTIQELEARITALESK